MTSHELGGMCLDYVRTYVRTHVAWHSNPASLPSTYVGVLGVSESFISAAIELNQIWAAYGRSPRPPFIVFLVSVNVGVVCA